MNHGSKLSTSEFLAILRESGGLYAKTAKAISEKYQIEYSRQAVRQRAENHPEVLADIEEENLDCAEDGLLTLMQSDAQAIRLKAIELYLKTKGKKRGYVEKSELDISAKDFKVTLNL